VVVDGIAVDPNGGNNDAGPYIEHLVQPSDTLEGILLRYGLSATELSRANNGCSGTNLNLYPNPLRVQKVPCNLPEGEVVSVEHTEQEKVSILRRALPSLSLSEAKCYLALNDWSTEDAIANAKEDGFSN